MKALRIGGCMAVIAVAAAAGLGGAPARAGEGFDFDSIPKDAALAAELPANIAKAGVLTVGSDTAYAPWEYISEADNKTVVGIDVDIGKAIGRVLGVKVEFQTSEFDSILPSLGSKYDIGISAFTITKERMKAVIFVSYSQSGALWAVKGGNPAKFDPADICGRTVALQSGTDVEQVVRNESKTCVDTGKKAVNMLPFSSQTEALTRVAVGGADATVSGSATIGYAVKQSDGKLETMEAVGRLALFDPNGIALAKSDMALAKVLAAATNKLIKDGTMAKILGTWGAADAFIPKAEINPEVRD